MFTNKRNLITMYMWQRGVLKQYAHFYIPVEIKGEKTSNLSFNFSKCQFLYLKYLIEKQNQVQG